MEKMRRIMLIQKDLMSRFEPLRNGNIDRYQRKSCTFSKPWRMTAPVKQLKLGKASNL